MIRFVIRIACLAYLHPNIGGSRLFPDNDNRKEYIIDNENSNALAWR